MELLYLDNAATSFPKPSGVARAVAECIERVAGSPGRGSSAGAREAERIVRRCRERLAAMFDDAPERFVFTLNTTDALNLAIKGVLASSREGADVLVGSGEHNSVMRPVRAIGAMQSERGGRSVVVRACPRDAAEVLDPALLDDASRVGLVVMSMVSNVTGEIHDLSRVVAWCKSRGVACVLDAAQAAVHVPMSLRAMREQGVDMVAFAGHKGLLGPMGVGVLWISPGFESRLATVREGGTGTRSESLDQPGEMPMKYEAGTPNVPGIAGLSEGLAFLLERGVEDVRRHERAMCEAMMARMSRLEACGYRLHGPVDVARRVAVFSFTHDRLAADEIAAMLETEFGIVTRAGLHCAPGAVAGDGVAVTTVRASFGAFNRVEDVERLVVGMEEIARG